MSEPTEGSRTTGARRVVRIWAPSALSTLFLVAEIPVIAAVLARGPQGTESLSAFGVVLGVIVVVNSPCLALTLTTTTLGRSVVPLAQIRRFALLLGGGLSVLLAVVALSGACRYLAVAAVGLSGPVANLVELGLLILSPAPLAVAWRRIHQGVLITARWTRPIAAASLIRILVSVTTTIGLLALSPFPGVAIGSIGLTAGAVAEALTVTGAARRAPQSVSGGSRIPPWELGRFHLSVAVLTMVTVAPQAVVAFVLPHGGDPIRSLAAWPVLYGLISLLTVPLTELEGISASFSGGVDNHNESGVTTAALALGVTSSLVLVAAYATPLGSAYFVKFSGTETDVAALGVASIPFLFCAPFLWALRARYRGMLIARGVASVAQWSALGHLTVLVTFMVVGSAWIGWPGLMVGAGSLTAAIAADLAFLWVRAPRPVRTSPRSRPHARSRQI